MPASVHGAQSLPEGLFQCGDEDTALGLITTNGPRSWLNMINSGSTLTTEAWNFRDKPNEDWNHAWVLPPAILFRVSCSGCDLSPPATARFAFNRNWVGR